MAAGLEVDVLAIVGAPATEQVGIEDAAAAAAVVLGVAAELVVGTGLVDGGRRVVVVASVVGVVIEGAGAQHRAEVVPVQDQLGQRTDPVGHQAALVEVAVAVVRVEAQQRIVRRLGAHADAVAGSERPVQGEAVVEFDGLAGVRRAAGQGDGGGEAQEREALGNQSLATNIVVIVHAAFLQMTANRPRRVSWQRRPARLVRTD